jgi:hypothetical protein
MPLAAPKRSSGHVRELSFSGVRERLGDGLLLGREVLPRAPAFGRGGRRAQRTVWRAMLPWMIGLAVWESVREGRWYGRVAVALVAREFVVATFNLLFLGGER